MTQTIGQRLKAEREAQKLTLERVFEVTRIRVPYLQALETDDLSSVPSPVQARGYLRNYAEFLGLDFQQLLDEMRSGALDTSGEIIGPADSAPSIPDNRASEDNVTASTPPTTPMPEALDVEYQPIPVEKETRSKPGRRRKADPRPEGSSTDSAPRRRGRKKIHPEPEIISPSEEELPEPTRDKPEVAEGPVGQAESPSHPEPAFEPVIEMPQDAVQSEVSDTLWQKWLNRLSSILSARMKRHTLKPREIPVLENDQGVRLAEMDVISPEEAYQVPAKIENLPAEQSSEIFKEIGIQLRERRELLSLHLDEVERNTRVKVYYLGALERGAMDDLPSTVQTRGMLANYATFLDMDVDALLLRFADALQARHRERNPQKPARKRGQPIIANVPPIRTFIAGDIIFGIGMAVLLVGFALWGVSRVVELQSQQEVQPTAPSISDVLLASPDPADLIATATPQPVEAFPGLATVTIVVPTQDLNVEVQVNLVATERTYMRVIVDGEVVFEGRAVPGNAYPFQAESQIEVLVGSGAAIRTVYNGRDLGLMGTFGQVVSNIYTAGEIITPTALPSPSPTGTAPPALTVTPTAASSATNTSVQLGTPTP